MPQTPSDRWGGWVVTQARNSEFNTLTVGSVNGQLGVLVSHDNDHANNAALETMIEHLEMLQ